MRDQSIRMLPTIKHEIRSIDSFKLSKINPLKIVIITETF